MADRIQIRRDTAADWTSNNPTLADGEIGLITDTDEYVVGDGTTAYSSLTKFEHVDGTEFAAATHASTHSDGGSDELTVENLATAGSSGQVPTSDGAGGLTMSTPSAGFSVALKTADESVTSSTTLQDDDHLTFSIGASETIVFYMPLQVNVSTAAYMKFGWSVPAGATMNWGWEAIGFTDTDQFSNLGAGDTDNITSTGVTRNMRFYGEVTSTGTSGTVTFQWAQNTSDATATTVHAGSFIMYKPV